jgi:iron complex outermembrane receptor protein
MGVPQRLFVTTAIGIALCSSAHAQTAGTAEPQQSAGTSAPPAASAAQSSATGDIVVTAQRRSESVNSIPLSITAVGGDVLSDRNIVSTADLSKIVPSFSAQDTGYDAPVYTIRGVGFFDYSLTAGTTVSVYTDEVALPFSVMTKAAGLDLQRVEVLKGPQGTLYGQNATGGAINYIANKPTDHFEAGLTGSFSRFNTGDVQGYISGPIANNLDGRFSFRTTQGGDWQQSYTRDDSLGAVHQTEGRALLAWTPTSRLKFTLNANGWIDKSDTLAGQLYQLSIVNPANAGPVLLNYPLAPHNDRAADWTPGKPFKRNDNFYQVALRGEYSIADGINLISISAYEHYKEDSTEDFDGTSRKISDVTRIGYISTASQELRLQGDIGKLKFVAGGNYEHDASSDLINYDTSENSNRFLFPPIGVLHTGNLTRNHISTYAGFGNVDYSVNHHITIHGGVRYTQSNRHFYGCTFDGGDGGFAQTISILESVLKGTAPQPLGVDQCLTLDSTFTPNPVVSTLREHNVSWRTGIDYKTDSGALLYASVSKGYKAGSFPTLSAATDAQFQPVKQESILSYEVGLKLPLLDHHLQFNAAAFYYDYRNKQIQGRVPDPVFGPINALVNIPKSRVEGAEAQVVATPFDGLHLTAATTYLQTKILRFTGYNQAGALQDFAGTQVPFSPKFAATGDAQYDWRLSDRLGAFLGASVTYNSSTFAQLGDDPTYRIKAYKLLDLRAGIKGPDNRWQIEIWGNNVTNEYYYTSVFHAFDTILRFAGRPATYGITGKINFR